MTDKNKYFENEQKIASQLQSSLETLMWVEEQTAKDNEKAKFFSGIDDNFKKALSAIIANDPGNNGLSSLNSIVTKSNQLSKMVLAFEEDYRRSLDIEKDRITELNKHNENETTKKWIWKSVRWFIGACFVVVFYSALVKLADNCDPTNFWKIPLKDLVVDCPAPPSEPVIPQPSIKKDT